MKRILCMCLILIALLGAFISAQATDCWYYEKYGTHDFEQTDVSLPSCTDDGYYVIECRQCGHWETLITGFAYGHSWGTPTHQDATCTTDGYTKWECANCNEVETAVIPATGHDMKDIEVLEPATCSQSGSMRTRCLNCSYQDTRVIPKLSHVYGNWTIVTPSTDHSNGQRARSCVNCGKKEQESFYPDGTLYRGMTKNDSVQHLQQMLIDLHFLSDNADGIFGKNTEDAVLSYQKYAHLEETGIAYPQTLRELANAFEAKNKQTDAPTSAPTPVPTVVPDVEAEYPPCCTRFIDEQGNEQVLHCKDHQILIDAYQTLIKSVDDESRRLRLCEQQRELWQAEIDNLFDLLILNASEEEKSDIALAKTGLSVMLAGQESFWKLSYKNDPVAGAEKICEFLIEQCSDLCSLAFDVQADGE